MDSSGFLALVSQRDTYHRAASDAWANVILRERWRTYTSNFIIAETHALFLVRLGHQPAATFLREMEGSATMAVPVRPGDERRAREIVYRYDDKDFSLTDAITFAMMERLAIPYAFTFDRHFAQYGFLPLTPRMRVL